MQKPLALLVAATIALGGCATSSKDIAATYISPLQYQSYDCEQLASETQRIQTRVAQLSGRLDEAAQNDKALVGVGVILFWPVLFAVGGTKEQEAEYARLKGEYDAVQQTCIAKKCPGAIAPMQTASTTGDAPAQAQAQPQAPVQAQPQAQTQPQ